MNIITFIFTNEHEINYMIMKKTIFFIVIFSLHSLIGICQDLKEGISYDTDKKYYVVTYCCSQDSSLNQGVYIPGNLVDPNIEVSVDFNSANNLYTYVYSIENETTAPRLLYSFSIHKNADITDLNNPTKIWIANIIERESIVRWHYGRGAIKGIKPGSMETGFSFNSNGMPSIVPAFASSNTFMGFPDEGPTNLELQNKLDSLEQATQHVNLNTIGPRRLADDIDNTSLLDTLYSYLNFSCDTTWIENQGICRSLETKLDNTRQQLDHNNNRAASNSLQSFINEVMALKDEQLSSEAFALLYFNGQYLLERLQE